MKDLDFLLQRNHQRSKHKCKLSGQKHEPEYSRMHRTNARRDGTGCSRGTRWSVRRPSGWRAGCVLQVSTLRVPLHKEVDANAAWK
jgi:hypothetical protein